MTNEEFNSLAPHFQWFDFVVRDILYLPNEPVGYVYFPVSGIASVIAVNAEAAQAETGIIGREGFVGIPVALYAESSPYTVIVQIEGRALRVSAQALQASFDANPRILQLLLQFTHVFGIQSSQTAVANAYYTIPQRLARWLVMCMDRIGNSYFQMTHQFLSVMLAVRRPGVTEAIIDLEIKKLIKWTRGFVTIMDREGLLEIAEGSYGVPEKEYGRLFPKHIRSAST